MQQQLLSMDDHNPEFPLLLLPRHDPAVHDNHQPNPFRIPSPALATLLSLNTVYVLLGPLACSVICLSGILEGQGNSRSMLGVTAWVFLWWLTGAVPVPVTALAPMYLFPAFGIAAADDVARSYMSDVIGLLLGSFILAIAIEHYNIHQRLALNITVLFCGDPARPALLLLGICATTAFVSFWMQNTAAAAMMMPVAMGVLQRLPEPEDVLFTAHGEVIDRFGRAVVLGVTYASAIGGMATLTGAAVNLVTVGMWSEYFPDREPISFSAWFVFGFPTTVVMFLALWGILCVVYLGRGSSSGTNPSASSVLGQYLDRAHLKRELDLLGPMAFAEKMVLSVFGALVVLWMTRRITDDIPGWGSLFKLNVGDGTVTIMMASLLFIIPNGKEVGEKLMDWNKCRKLQWNVILLLGGGLAIADGVRTSGLADLLSTGLTFLHDVPYLAVAPIVCVISSGITEFISNNATATLVMPILIELANTVGMHPLMLMIPGAIGAEFAYLLPIGTPSNIVGYATGRIGMRDMFKVGLPLKVVGIAVVAVLTPTLGVLAFGTNHQKF